MCLCPFSIVANCNTTDLWECLMQKQHLYIFIRCIKISFESLPTDVWTSASIHRRFCRILFDMDGLVPGSLHDFISPLAGLEVNSSAGRCGLWSTWGVWRKTATCGDLPSPYEIRLICFQDSGGEENSPCCVLVRCFASKTQKLWTDQWSL